MKKKHLQPLAPAALYARVSSHRRDVDLSVSAQLRALEIFFKNPVRITKATQLLSLRTLPLPGPVLPGPVWHGFSRAVARWCGRSGSFRSSR